MSVGAGDRLERIVREETGRYLRFLLELDPWDAVPRINRDDWNRAVKGQRGDQVRRD